MATFKVHKVVGVLPAQLQADAVYLARAGTGFDLFVSDSTGAVAHRVNNPAVWHAATLTPPARTSGTWTGAVANAAATPGMTVLAVLRPTDADELDDLDDTTVDGEVITPGQVHLTLRTRGPLVGPYLIHYQIASTL